MSKSTFTTNSSQSSGNSNPISGFNPLGTIYGDRIQFTTNGFSYTQANPRILSASWAGGGSPALIQTTGSWDLKESTMTALSFSDTAVAIEFNLESSLLPSLRREAAWGLASAPSGDIITNEFVASASAVGLCFGGTDDAGASNGNSYIYAGNGTTGTLVALSAGSLNGVHKYKILFYPADRAEFYLDDSLVGTITTNLPAAGTINFFAAGGNPDGTVVSVDAPTINWTK